MMCHIMFGRKLLSFSLSSIIFSIVTLDNPPLIAQHRCNGLFDSILTQKPMEAQEAKSVSGYDKPPWIFKGSALYQLHLVKAETARAFIPKEFRLVEAFGYTLGGFFLASYDDSPAGIFDELVVIAGTVWNPPTSCAWAARVFVNSDEACIHGRRDVGLPSQVARISKSITATARKTKSKIGGTHVQVTEINGPASTGICNISLSSAAPKPNSDKWMGPLIKMSLPSFSGCTEYNPHLLKYSCQIQCSALHRLHLVKAETTRAIIPKEFRLLEAFGYTLGGFFLAHYDESPAGTFDELVMIAGTGKIWNHSTS